MMIWRDRPLANDNQEGPASCKWSSGGAGLLQMIIWRAAAVRGEIGDFKIHELSFVFSGRSTRWARKASSSMSGHMLNPRSTMWRSPSLRWSAVYAQDLHWGDILPVVPVTQGREQSWEREISSVVNISPLFTAIFSVWCSEIFLLLTINDYQLVSRLDSVLRSWRFI